MASSIKKNVIECYCSPLLDLVLNHLMVKFTFQKEGICAPYIVTWENPWTKYMATGFLFTFKVLLHSNCLFFHYYYVTPFKHLSQAPYRCSRYYLLKDAIPHFLNALCMRSGISSHFIARDALILIHHAMKYVLVLVSSKFVNAADMQEPPWVGMTYLWKGTHLIHV